MHFVLLSYIIINVAEAITNKYGPLAHLVEHLTLNQGVRGSSPRRPTRKSIGFAEEAAESVFFYRYKYNRGPMPDMWKAGRRI